MRKDDMRKYDIHVKSYFRTKEIRRNLANALRGKVRRFESSGERNAILKSVCAGMVDHLYRNNGYRWRNGDDVERELAKESVVRSASWIVGLPWDLQVKTRRGGMITLRLIRMVTRVDPAWLTEVAPQLAEAKDGLNPTYSPEKDVVVSTTETFFNGQKVREDTVADGEHPEAAKVFARWLSAQSSLPPVNRGQEVLVGDKIPTNYDWSGYSAGQTLDAALRSNAARRERARELNLRAGAKVFYEHRDAEIETYYTERLAGARCIKEVVEPDALLLSPLDQDAIDRVMNENPDTIEVLGVEHAVVYRSGYHPRVQLDSELVTAHRWIELADQGYALPGGREIEIVVSFGYYDSVADTNIPRLKEKARERLNREQWDRWDRPEIPVPDPEDEESQVPFVTAVFGQCVVTGEELKAYGTAAYQSRLYRSGWETVWYRDEDEAKTARHEACQKLDELKAEQRERAEREQARAAAEAAREELREMSNLEGWTNLDYELRRKVEGRRYSYLPSSTEELAADKAETEALIAEVKAEFAQMRRQREQAEARRAQATTRVDSLLRNHLVTCPFCGKELEWDEEDVQWVVQEGRLRWPCSCYPEHTLGETLAAIEAGITGELIEVDNRSANVLFRLMVGDQVAIQFAVYYKYGCWNFGFQVEVDAAIADGEVELVKVWHEPTENEIRLAELRAQRDEFDREIVSARSDAQDGYACLLSFRQGKHPKTGEEQWEAGSRKKGVKYILARESRLQPLEGRQYYCREIRTLVDTPRFRLILVDAFLPADPGDLDAEIAKLKAEIQDGVIREGGADPDQAESKAVSEPEPESERAEDTGEELVGLGDLAKGFHA
jgi:hypothetical protein